MRMAVEKPDPTIFSYKFQRLFNTSAFSWLAVQTETKMIIFMSGLLQCLNFFLKILDTVSKKVEMIDIHQNLGFVYRLLL